MELSEDEIQYLLSNIESFAFVENNEVVGKYKCVKCGNVAIKYILTNCKHIICCNCITEVFDKACPVCINVNITEMRKDVHLQKEMLNLVVECQNKVHGCQQIITLHEYKEHLLTKCQFSKKVPALKMNEGQGEADALKEVADDILQKFSEKIETMANDVVNMKNQLHQESDARKNFEQEVNKKIIAAEELLSGLIGKQTRVEANCVYEEQPSEALGWTNADMDEMDEHSFHFIWKVACYSSLISSKVPDCQKSGEFHCKEIGITFRICVFLSKKRKHLHVCIEHLKKDEVEIVLHARKYTLFDQSDRTEKKHVSIIDTPYISKEPQKTMTRGSFIFLNLVPFSMLEEQNSYVRDDAFYIKLSLIPLSLMYKSVAANNGTLLWRIENYSAKKEDEISGYRRRLLSPSFYTSPQGYRVQGITYLNGTDASKGKCVSIYISFIIGEFDKDLRFPFNSISKISLIDQSESSTKEHVCHEILGPYHQCNHLHGRHDFVLINKAEEARYLKNDTLLFKIAVHIM